MMLHHVKQQVAAAAHAVEIPHAGQHLPALWFADDVLTAFSDVAFGGAITARGDVGAGLHDDATRQGILSACGIADDASAPRDGVSLNNLDDWYEFHQAVLR